MQRCSAQTLPQVLRQGISCHARLQISVLSKLHPGLIAESTVTLKAKHPAKLGVVTEFGVGIQRQVPGQQTGVRCQQTTQAPAFHSGDTGILPLPEISVMDHNGVCLQGDGRLDQFQTGGNPADQCPYFRPTLDLETIRTIILKALAGEQHIGVFSQFLQGNHAFTSCCRTVVMTAVM